jgi:hypothetical protein
MAEPVTLRTAIGRYPRSASVLDGAVTSPLLRIEDAGIRPISRAFAPMARERPELVVEIVRLFGATGRSALDPALALAIRYCTEQGLLPRPLTLSDVWSGTPRGLTEPPGPGGDQR